LGWTVAYVAEGVVLARGVGDQSRGKLDTALSIDLATGEFRKLIETQPYALGDVRCTPRCGGLCLMADASLGALRRWTVGLEELEASKVDGVVGLPPRFLGGF
jgi:hypothetical protein